MFHADNMWRKMYKVTQWQGSVIGMEFFDFLKGHASAPDARDESIYEFIASELAQKQVKQGLWTKALADSEWDEAKAKASYVRMRYEQIKEQIAEQDRQQRDADTPEMVALRSARAAGLNEEEIEYLGIPIKAIHYLKKYAVTDDNLAHACAMKILPSVLNNGVLWVRDQPIARKKLW
jgi:hypothetical protein